MADASISNGYDVFVSYAHYDDQPLPSIMDEGWVTTLKINLERMLRQKLGGAHPCEIWMDHELRHGRPITPELLDKVRRSAILLVILSPAYLQSEWCRRELEAFADLAASEGQGIFVIERDQVPDVELPSALIDLKRARFWSPDPKSRAPRTFGMPEPKGDRAYFDAVSDLVRDMAEKLRELKGIASRRAVTAATAANGTVFLAEVTDDLDEENKGIQRYLDQFGIHVVPETSLPSNPEAFREAVKKGLEQADIFVQLLSEHSGKRPPDLPEGRIKCQLDLAHEFGKRILQWRNSTLNIAAVKDEAQRVLLDGPSVRAEGIEEFKRAILGCLEEVHRPPSPPISAGEACILVDRYSLDKHLARQVIDILGRYDIWAKEPDDGLDNRKFNRDLQDKLKDCDGLIMVYGAAPKSWVDEHLNRVMKARALRRKPMRGIALLFGPPPDEKERSIFPPRLKEIDWRAGVQDAEIRRFLDSLEGHAA